MGEPDRSGGGATDVGVQAWLEPGVGRQQQKERKQ